MLYLVFHGKRSVFRMSEVYFQFQRKFTYIEIPGKRNVAMFQEKEISHPSHVA